VSLSPEEEFLGGFSPSRFLVDVKEPHSRGKVCIECVSKEARKSGPGGLRGHSQTLARQ
jgi:hypothetical protein